MGIKPKIIYTADERREVQRLNLKRWRKNNPDKNWAISKLWRERNREKLRIEKSKNQSRRIANKKLQTHSACCKITETFIFSECRRLTKETKIQHNVDHIIPIAHGGFHHHLNLQILPWFINQEKNANPFWKSESFKCWKDVPRFLWPKNLKQKYLKLIK